MAGSGRLGCLVRTAPYADRSGRAQLDLVLAAALCGWSIELFFCGPGMLHLAADKKHALAGLPGTWRGWKSLAELGPVQCWVASGEMQTRGSQAVPALLDFEELERGAITERLRACDRVMVL